MNGAVSTEALWNLIRDDQDPPLVHIDELPQIEVSLPESLWELPTIVKSCAVVDRLSRWCLEQRSLALMRAENISVEQARARIYPATRGRPFLEVWHNARKKLVCPKFGGAGFQWNDTFERFEREIAAYSVVLGLSISSGGGPGVMRQTSRLFREMEQKARNLGLKRMFSPELISVLLWIGKEAPNIYVDPKFTVRAQEALKARTAMLLCIGCVYCIMFYPGGFGTLEELWRAGTDHQLFGHISTALQQACPLVLLDYRRANGKMRWGWLDECLEGMLEDGCIKEADLHRFQRIDVGQPNAAKTAMEIKLASINNILGIDLAERFERDNGMSFREAASEFLL